VEVAIPNDSLLLKPGMFATVRIVISRNDSAQTVPSAAVVVRDGASAVFTVDDTRKARLVPVEVGIVDGERTEIVSPKLSGSVVTVGNHLLTDGAEVIVPNAVATDQEGGGRAPGSQRPSRDAP
jgi:multidrug efflux pump subunit AcrA (membrane-fusion protein)